MGLDFQNYKFLCLAQKLGVDFSSTLVLGRQEIIKSPFLLSRLFSEFGIDSSVEYLDLLLEQLGAKCIDTLDISSYEEATIIHDLNSPPPLQCVNKYTSVIDFGTLEHVFNYANALKHVMTCVAKHGHFISSTPANNLMGHGFWQVSPELFLRAFSDSNGYVLNKLILADQFDDSPWHEFDLAQQPHTLKTRWSEPALFTPAYLMVIAQRYSICPPFQHAPQQLSYADRWESGNDQQEHHHFLSDSKKDNHFGSTLKLFVKNTLARMGFLRFIRLWRIFRLAQHQPSYIRRISTSEWHQY